MPTRITLDAAPDFMVDAEPADIVVVTERTTTRTVPAPEPAAAAAAAPAASEKTPEELAAEAAAKALAEKRSAAAVRAAATRRRNLTALPSPPAEVTRRIRGTIIPGELPPPEEFATKHHYENASRFAKEVGAANFEKLLGTLVASGRPGSLAIREMLKVYCNDPAIREGVAKAIGSAAKAPVVTDAIIRQVFRARCAARQPASSGAGSRFRKRLAEMRTAPKPTVIRPAMAKLGIPWFEPAKDYSAKTFPNLASRTAVVRIGAVSKVVVERAGSKPVSMLPDSKALKLALGEATAPKVRYLCKREALNVRDDLYFTALDREYRSMLEAAARGKALDNGKVKPHEWSWLLHRTMLAEHAGSMCPLLVEPGDKVRPLTSKWTMVKRVNVAPLIFPQSAAFVLSLLHMNALELCDETRVVQQHLQKDGRCAALLGIFRPSQGSHTLDDSAGIAMPSGRVCLVRPDDNLAALKKDPEATASTDGVVVADISATLLADGFDKLREEKLTFKDFAVKFLGMDEASGMVFQKEWSDKFKAVVGLTVVEVDPSVDYNVAYFAFAYDDGFNQGVWAKQAGNDLPPSDFPFNRQFAAQSCMRSTAFAQRCAAFYANNTTSKLLLVVDATGRIHVRAILWVDVFDGATGKRLPPFVERFYLASGKAAQFLSKYCLDAGYISRKASGDLRGVSAPGIVTPFFGENEVRSRYSARPYLDTFNQCLYTLHRTSSSGLTFALNFGHSPRVDNRRLYASGIGSSSCPTSQVDTGACVFVRRAPITDPNGFIAVKGTDTSSSLPGSSAEEVLFASTVADTATVPRRTRAVQWWDPTRERFVGRDISAEDLTGVPIILFSLTTEGLTYVGPDSAFVPYGMGTDMFCPRNVYDIPGSPFGVNKIRIDGNVTITRPASVVQPVSTFVTTKQTLKLDATACKARLKSLYAEKA